MRTLQTTLDEVILIEPRVLSDDRGYLFESYNRESLSRLVGAHQDFVLDLQSRSSRGVIRGIHYQLSPPQAKLIRVVQGSIFDVAVDLRRSSPGFGQWMGVELSAENRRQVLIPPGFGHAFLAVSDTVEVLYKLSSVHAPDFSRTIAWNDQDIAVDWPLRLEDGEPILSPKDMHGTLLREAEVFP